MHPEPESIETLEIASRCARGVIEVLQASPPRKELIRALVRGQRRLARELLTLGGESDDGGQPAIVWTNAYYAVRIEGPKQPRLQQGEDPHLDYVFAHAATAPEEQELCREVEQALKTELPGHTHLSEVFRRKDSPKEVTFGLSKDDRLGWRFCWDEEAQSFFDPIADELQWYRDALFQEATGAHPEHQSWRYVHLGLPQRDLLPMNSGGVYVMMRDHEAWRRLRRVLVPGLRSFLLEVLTAHLLHRLQGLQKRELREARTLAYSLGHPFKHRANDIADQMRAFIRLLQDTTHQMQEDQRAGDAGTTLAGQRASAMLELERKANEVECFVRPARSFGELANAVGGLIEAEGPEGLLSRPEWHSLSEVWLGPLMETVCLQARRKQRADIRLRAQFSEEISTLVVEPWIAVEKKGQSDPESYAAPSSEILQHVFFEIVHNAATHGRSVDGQVTLDVCTTKDASGRLAVLFRNDIPCSDTSPSEGTGERFVPVKSGAPSGGSLLRLLLDYLGEGNKVEYRFTRTPDRESEGVVGVWEYRLFLRGMKHA